MSIQNPTQLPAAYANAVYTKNIEAFLALYADKIHIFDAWENWQAEGKDALRTSTTEWFNSLGNEKVVITCHDIQTSSSDTLATLHALIQYKAVSADGQDLRAMQERITWVMEHTPAGWTVTHQHTSLPASFQTGKVMKATPDSASRQSAS